MKNKERFRLLLKNEKGSFAPFTLMIILGLLIIAVIFMNIVHTMMTINFAKKSLDEATRTRALAVDIPLKEYTGVIEVMHKPHQDNKALEFIGVTRPGSVTGSTNQEIAPIESAKYSDAVKYAEDVAKESMIQALMANLGNNLNMSGNKIIEIDRSNICFDVEPIGKEKRQVEFRCALKSPGDDYGHLPKVKTITSKPIEIPGFTVNGPSNALNPKYEDILYKVNPVNSSQTIYASNVVFGVAVVRPRSFLTSGLEKLGFMHQPEIVIYSTAYPQIDDCFGESC